MRTSGRHRIRKRKSGNDCFPAGDCICEEICDLSGEDAAGAHRIRSCHRAYCGAVSAGCGAGAGVCYLLGGGYEEIAHTVVNALAIESGVICDGAKSSCAAKVASAVEAGLVGMEMTKRGSEFRGGDGILEKGVENTIRNVSDLARNGMRETNEEIIRLMIKTV